MISHSINIVMEYSSCQLLITIVTSVCILIQKRRQVQVEIEDISLKVTIDNFLISEKPAERKVPNDIFCKICLQNDFPLKRMKKNEWYHITCLMFHDISNLQHIS